MIKVTRIKETNSPHQHLMKCTGNSVENMHTDVWGKGIQAINWIQWMILWTNMVNIYIVPRPFLYYPVNLLLERTLYVWTKILFTGLTIAWFAQRQCLPIQCLVHGRNLTEIWIIICETDGYLLVLSKWQLLQNQMKYSTWWMVEIIFHHVPRLLSNYTDAAPPFS